MARRRLLPLLVVLGLALAPAVSASPGHQDGRPASARDLRPDRSPPGRGARPRGLTTLPLAAQGSIATALGRANPAYWIRGGLAENPAQNLRLAFSAAGVRVRSARGFARISLIGVGRGATLHPVGGSAPAVDGNRVTYARGALREWYANGPLGLEQGFDLARRPSGRSGPLVLAVALSGNLHASARGDAVMLSGAGTTLRYTAPSASDARGRRLSATVRLTRGRLLISVDDRGARYPIRVDPFVQQAQLTASDGGAGDDLGFSVAASGQTIVAGAPFHQVGANPAQGAVYVFAEPRDGWANATQTAELIASDGGPRDQLGAAVAISGNTIVAGAPYHQVAANAGQGAAYVFAEPASGWASATQTAELTASDGAASDGLGSSVAVSGNTVVAGAPFHSIGANADQGAADVFVEPPSGWTNTTQAAELTATDGSSFDELGSSVATSGNAVVAGAPYHQVGATIGQGAAYVFAQPTAGWASETQTAELTASDGRSYDYLGMSVAVSANTIVAGAPYRQVGGNSAAGAAYVFVEPPTGWSNAAQNAELIASDGAASDYLGLSVSVSGNVIAAGAPYHQVSGQVWQGVAYVYVEPPTGWANAAQTAELSATGGGSMSYLGLAVAVSGATVVAGAPGAPIGVNSTQGTAVVFGVPQPTAIALACTPQTVVVGQASTCTARAAAAGGAKPDGGEMAFVDRGRPIPGCAAVPLDLSTGSAACHARFAIPGSEPIQAVYSGDTHFAPSQSPGFPETVKASITLRGGLTGRSGVVTFRLSCASRSSGCRISGTLATMETVEGKKVLAVTARAKRQHRLVIVGARTVRIGAGKAVTITIALNATGRRLLTQFTRLPVRLTVSLLAAGQSTAVATRRLSVTP